MMLHRNAATAAASRASGQATNADFHRSVAVAIIALLLLGVLARLWVNSERPGNRRSRDDELTTAGYGYGMRRGRPSRRSPLAA